MVYGFYTELEERQEEDEIGWEFLENLCYKHLSAFDFLHGYCFDFAEYLHKVYGYTMECIYANDGSLIHAYCIIEQNNKTLFIDIRGVTDDWIEFKDEFADWMTEYDEANYYLKKNPKIPRLSKKKKEEMKEVFDAIKSFVNENNDFYDKEYWIENFEN